MAFEDVDFLIVGGGCAGLSLAVHLLEARLAQRPQRVAIIEPRTTYTQDRTWCFWGVTAHPFQEAISHTWESWEVRHQDIVTRSQSTRYPYHHLPADRFYQLALERIEASDCIELHLGVRVEKLEEHEDGVIAMTSAGEIRARLAFDSRPPGARKRRTAGVKEVTLLQHFKGWTIRTQEPAFDPSTVTLMDFDVPQTHGIHFFYVLPFDAHTALLEATFFTPDLLAADQYDPLLTAYLYERLHIKSWEKTYEEFGILPMSTHPHAPKESRHIYQIGQRGGLAKASTGYAFLAIQRFSAQLAQQLLQQDLPEPPAARPARSLFLDRVFLSYLHRAPQVGPALFARLFSGCETERLIRFLSDVGTWKDDLHIMRAMPKLPLILETLRSYRLWCRRQPALTAGDE